MWHPALLLLAASVLVAHASLFVGESSQPIVDGWSRSHPLDGRYVVLLRESELRALPAEMRVEHDRHAHGMRLLVVGDETESSLRTTFHDAVAISPDREVTRDAVWNLDRLDERRLVDNDGTWTGPSNGGAGVHIYVVDGGVDTGHPEFGGRADTVYTAFGADTTDSCGHGTHVAGTAAGFTRGVARGAALHSVKVLRGEGCTGTLGNLASGLLDTLGEASGKRAVINLSLGFTGFDGVIESLVEALIAAGHIVVAAAGNSATSACVHYPSSYPGVVAVAATTRFDSAASFSNYGSCVDLYAPGVGVESADAGSDGFTELDGTSMASPHVAGVAALLWQQHPGWSSHQVVAALLRLADSDQATVINRRGSPDLLLFWTSELSDQLPSPSPIPLPPSPSRSRRPERTSGSTTSGDAAQTVVVCLVLVVMMQALLL